ncbi:MAG: hypothetical protein LUH07_16000 [Lachnospiraceae bacterium]|nr:hypothetical protein [Lachnospiraceae bacterium]
MPKYYDYKVAGYYLYFTSFCTVECMHVHASDRKMTEAGSAKFFVKEDGDSVLQNRGMLLALKKASEKNGKKTRQKSKKLPYHRAVVGGIYCQLCSETTKIYAECLEIWLGCRLIAIL